MSAIDPGVEDEINEKGNEVENDKPGDELEQEEEADFLQPSRWWFASTASPLLAGTFGPMASGFNICALAYYWRQTVPVNELQRVDFEGHLIKDPQWLVVRMCATQRMYAY